MIIYISFIILTVLSAIFNKHLIDNQQVGNVTESNHWHNAQFIYWIAVFLTPITVLIGVDSAWTLIWHYGVRVGLYGLIYSSLYNTILNKLRGLEWNHTGTNDFAGGNVLALFAIAGVCLIIVFELIII